MLLVNNCFSQKPYLTKAVIESFSPISSGTALNTVSNADDEFEVIDLQTINFSFIFNNRTYDKLYVSSNGIISLNQGITEYTNDLTSTSDVTGTDLIAPFWDDLYSSKENVSYANSSYIVAGSAPNRSITIEWNMFPHIGLFDNNDQKVTFQVTIFENSNQLKFNYKRNNFTNYYMSASVGFKMIPFWQ